MESRTYVRNVRISPRKLRFYTGAIKKMVPSQALEYLMYVQSKPAKIFYSAVKSAISNAKNALKTDDNKLKFKALIIEEGQKLKRFNPGGRGTAKPYVKRYSHIKILLETSDANISTKGGSTSGRKNEELRIKNKKDTKTEAKKDEKTEAKAEAANKITVKEEKEEKKETKKTVKNAKAKKVTNK